MLLAASARSDEEGAAWLAEARDFGRSLGTRARQRVRSRPTPKCLAGCVEAVLERLGFEPYQAADNETRLRNCPFEPLSRRYTPVECGVGQALVGGVVEGVGSKLRVSRDEHPDQCCVVLS
jgi:predicted ArsR family transcriptional regulator